MAKLEQDFRMWQGETKLLIIHVEDGQGDPVDITGSSIVWVMQRQTYNTTQPRIEKSTPIGIDVLDGPAGIFQVRLDPADTLGLPAGNYLHEAEVTDSGGQVSVVTIGCVRLSISIT